MTPPAGRPIAFGVTGASGVIYALRTMAALLAQGCHLEIVFSDYGRRLLQDEIAPDARVDRLRDLLEARYGSGVTRGTFTVSGNRDLGAALASGSHRVEAMVIVPCSMKTLAGVAHGLSRNLIERAGDVMLKEGRRLVLVPRETPMSLPALRNLVAAAEAGAVILPAMPAFYQQPATMDDLADFMAGKILNALGFDQQLFPAWTGKVGRGNSETEN
jgi:4-hydroxy-3-polyprenylbenzoate decarboxylase